MKYVFCLIFLCCVIPSPAQNFVTNEGEFMDTVSAGSPAGESIPLWYYSVGGKYPRSSATLLKEVKAFTEKSANPYAGSGYITFRFIIDTTGRMLKKVQVLQTDEQYKSHHFDKALVNTLFAYVKTLNKWSIARPVPGRAFPYHAYLTFKMKNGKVIAIIP
jgi:hypothetical protein